MFAQTFAQNIEINAQPLEHELSQLYIDAWLVGTKDGITQLEQAGVHPVATPVTSYVYGVDWDMWTPGHPVAAAKLEGTGLQDMLDQIGLRIKGIDDTTRDEIAKILQDGVAKGKSVSDIAREIDVVRKNPYRSHLIAVTEVNRAMTQASLDSYQRDGIEMFNLLTEATACAICHGIAADNPHPISDVADAPPIHPQCRCASSPVVEF